MNRYQDCANRPLLYFLQFLPRESAAILDFGVLTKMEDLDSAPQNLLETAKQITRYKSEVQCVISRSSKVM